MTSAAATPSSPRASAGSSGSVTRFLRRFVGRVGHAWVENPSTLIRFAARLAGAWRCFLFDLSPRELGSTLKRFSWQTLRTLFRGVFAVAGLGLAVGIGVGAVARAVGPGLQADFGRIVLVALLRDAGPLMLTVLIAGRMGGSIAARLGDSAGDDRGISDRDLTRLVLPHLVAGTVSAALFYGLGAFLIVKGFVGLGDPARMLAADAEWYLRLRTTESALWLGFGKSAAFGGLVAYIASAYGLRARERAGQLGAWRRVDVRQDAVWETSVTAILLATAISVLFWLTVEEPLR